MTNPVQNITPLQLVRPQMGRMLLEQGKASAEDVERVLQLQQRTHLPFGEAALHLGLIEQADIDQVLARQFDYPYLQPGQGGYPPELVAAFQPFGKQAEMLRELRSTLMQRWFANGHGGLAIVGVNTGDGTSLLAANLAIAFSQLGERTLLVDANMRAPRQHAIFRFGQRPGLSDLLAGRTSLDAIAAPEHFPSLAVLTAGTRPPNPHELIHRPAFYALWENLAALYDVILYDAPAFSVASDALSIATRTGGVMIVARRHETGLAAAKSAAARVQRCGATVVGSILNQF